MSDTKPAFKIEPRPNHTGYQALGAVKGDFDYLEDQTGANAGRGILKTEYGNFPAFVHIKCRSTIKRLSSDSQYFLVWFRNRLVTEDNNATIQFTVVGCGNEGVDNTFLITGALIGGNKVSEYQFIISRNNKSKTPTKHKVKFSTRNFKVRVSSEEDIWELYRHKLAALVCKLVDGKLQVVSHQLISEELPDASILKSLRKKLKKKNNKIITVDVTTTKALVKKKITVGVIGNSSAVAQKALGAIAPVKLELVEPVKKKVLELPRK